MAYISSDQLYNNSLNFKRALDRIAAKYSKLQYEEGAMEVDLNNIRLETLNTYMSSSRKVLNKLESKSLTDLHEESLSRQDVTGNSQLDFTYNCGGEKTCSSTSELDVEDNTENEKQEGMLSSLNETYGVLSDSEIQPEDQDEKLQTSLSSHGSSLVELYPSMVSRIERAWHRQHVSEAANSVLRRYRRWRQQPKRSNFNSTFDVTLRHTNRNHKMSPSKELQENSSPVKRARPETTPRSIQQPSPSKHRALPHPILVMDFSEKPKEMSLKDTFIVPELSPQPGERVSINTAGPSYISAKSSIDSLFRDKKHFISAQSAESSTYARESPAGNERSDIYCSPVRQSPSKIRVVNAFSRSPHASSRSPQGHVLGRCSRESLKPASWSVSLAGPPKRSGGQLMMFHHQDPHQVSQPRSPWSARRGDGPHRFRRHLSFDSSLSRPISQSPNKIDEDFTKVYHKFVCQNKSPYFNSHPCRLCARSAKVSQGFSSSSSSLAALALSPHRSILWRRHGELRSDSYFQSKRLREECGENSPGSKRHRREMWGRRLSSELEPPHIGSSYSPSKLRIQQPAARQDAWMDRRRIESAADFPYSGRLK